MYLLDANVLLEVLYKRSRWEECFKLLNLIKNGDIKAYLLHFAVHGISAILGKPDIVAKFLSELTTWRGLSVVDLTVEEEALASEVANKVGLDFDDGLHYYFARKANVPLVSFDRDFDSVDVKRLEPIEVLER